MIYLTLRLQYHICLITFKPMDEACGLMGSLIHMEDVLSTTEGGVGETGESEKQEISVEDDVLKVTYMICIKP